MNFLIQMISWIGSALKVAAEFLGIWRERRKDMNRPEMVKRKEDRSEVEERSKDEKAVEKKDADEIRRRLAE